MQKLKISLIVFLIIVVVENCFSQTSIYRITIDGKKIQTGFKIKGLNGIITALHGIAGYNKISVQNFGSKQIYNDNINIIRLDIASDICIISSALIENISLIEGYDINADYRNEELKGATVRINGFPLGMFAKQNNDIKFDNDNPIVELQTFLPSLLASKLITRGSPKTNIMIFDLHGAILPGHSGAPILYHNEVIGMADGGLNSGNAGYGWAIILKNVVWSNFVSNDSDYEKLSKNTNGLYTYEYSPDLVNDIRNFQTPDDINCQIIQSIISECKSSFNNLIGDYNGYAGTKKFYNSKANYFNALATQIIILGEMNNSRYGFLSCLLYQENNIYNYKGDHEFGDNNDWYTVPSRKDKKKLTTSSLEYGRLYQNYLLVRSIITRCITSKITNTDTKDFKNGEITTFFELRNDDCGIYISIEGSRSATWNLSISFFNKLSVTTNLQH